MDIDLFIMIASVVICLISLVNIALLYITAEIKQKYKELECKTDLRYSSIEKRLDIKNNDIDFIKGRYEFLSRRIDEYLFEMERLANIKKDKTKEDIILEEIEKYRETLEKNINDRLKEMN